MSSSNDDNGSAASASPSSSGSDASDGEAAPSRIAPSELKDYNALLTSLDHSHRADLATHLVAAFHLRKATPAARSRQSALFRNIWTRWPLPASQVPRAPTRPGAMYGENHVFDRILGTEGDGAGADAGSDDGAGARSEASEDADYGSSDSDVESASESDGGYGPAAPVPSADLYEPPAHAHTLLCEITASASSQLAAGVRARASTGLPKRQADFGHELIEADPDEIEQAVLYPHLHRYVLDLVDSTLDGLAEMRAAQAPKLNRNRVKPMDWSAVLGVAALVHERTAAGTSRPGPAGGPDGSRDNTIVRQIVADASARCEALFDERMSFDPPGNDLCNVVETAVGELSAERGWDPASTMPAVKRRKTGDATVGARRRAEYAAVLERRRAAGSGAGSGAGSAAGSTAGSTTGSTVASTAGSGPSQDPASLDSHSDDAASHSDASHSDTASAAPSATSAYLSADE
ncbi:uncharacterized protein V1510DRAFT_431110 [Dipodascopsis tothii]|uniref:uncharacterized protein n=1 Tax=Dipodascopsis tothii TaxID=44089 RepID=UPI0034CD8000